MLQPKSAVTSRIPRAVVVAAVGVVGAFAVTHTAAYQLRSENAGLAHRLAPYDGRITALAAAYRSGPEASVADRRAGNSLARLALRQDSTAVVAASTMGLNAQVFGKIPDARRKFAYAGFLSRREIQTQLWAIEDAAGRGNVKDALRHYDIAMRATPSLSQMLFPVLASASTDPEIRVALIKTLAAKPPWGTNFIAYVAANTSDPRSTARLLTSSRGTGVAVPDGARAGLIASLISAGFVDDAWNFYASYYRQADRRSSRDPRFTGMMNPPSQFDWIIAASDGISASIQRSAKYGIVDFTAPSMVGGAVVQQMQLLPVGTYQLTGHSSGIEQSSGASPYWLLRCQGGKEIGRVNIPNSSNNDGNFRGTFDVPLGCPIQVLSLVVRPSEDVSGLFGQIDFLQLKPTK